MTDAGFGGIHQLSQQVVIDLRHNKSSYGEYAEFFNTPAGYQQAGVLLLRHGITIYLPSQTMTS